MLEWKEYKTTSERLNDMGYDRPFRIHIDNEADWVVFNNSKSAYFEREEAILMLKDILKSLEE